MLERRVPLDGHDIPYLYGTDCAQDLADALARTAGAAESVLFVVDRRVTPHALPVIRRLSSHLRTETYEIEATEPNKTMALVQDIAEHAVARRVNRSSLVVGMGGGLVGNVAGLTAALLFRGTRLVHLPTTPVAAFDSVVSVKQAVNLRGGKNLCGTYYTPSLIACDLRWLATVPHSELLTGLAEMAKNVLAITPHMEETLHDALQVLPKDRTTALQQLFGIGLDSKIPFLGRDPRERKEALVFEYGHTTGHALEFMSNGAMKHGEAVAWGMLVAAEVSRNLGVLSHEDLERHYRIVDWLGLPDPGRRLAFVDPAELRAKLSTDNKRGYVPCGPDEAAMVLLESLGSALTGSHGYPLVAVDQEAVVSALATVTAGTNRLEGGERRWTTSSAR
ncbi:MULTISPECIES: iron-containing alcohol dehydrogenase [unclassified Streptomyces]|uniref:3-dehydroquinate synthase family protein n=1 Tax=unclassified Streptomyces TaxID=2593676 RepID=UPI0036A5343D